MALYFNNGTGDRVTVTSAASIEGLDPFTIWGWFYVVGRTSSDRLWSKAQTANARELLMSGTSGDIQVVVGRATAFASFVTNDVPLATDEKWYFIAVTFNSGNGAGEAVQLYVGDLTTKCAERAYGTSTNGSGAVNADTGNALYIGNNSVNTRSFPGRIGPFGIINRELTLAECISLQWNPRVVSGTVLYHELGYNGTGTQPDWSGNGNSGVVTTATQVAHPPLRPMTTGLDGWTGNVAAAGGATLTPDALAVPATLPAPSLSLGAVSIAPSALSVAATVPAASLGLVLALAPSAVVVPVALPEVAVWSSATALGVPVTFPEARLGLASAAAIMVPTVTPVTVMSLSVTEATILSLSVQPHTGMLLAASGATRMDVSAEPATRLDVVAGSI